jgi:hypothetical protein
MTMNRNHLIGAAAVTVAGLILGRAWTVVHAQTAPRFTETIDAAPAVPAPKNVIVYQDGNALIHSVLPVTSGNQVYAYGVSPAEDDPEMGELANVEAQASQESAELLSRYAATENAADQKELKAKLRTALEDQFRVQLKRQQIELARIEERVRKLREQFKKRNDTRDTIIDRRLDQLINEAEGLGWTQPSGAVPQSSSWAPVNFQPAGKRNNRTPLTPAKR